jgi:hypothetical protein
VISALAVAGLALLGISSGILVVVYFWVFRTLQVMSAAEAIVPAALGVMSSGHMHDDMTSRVVTRESVAWEFRASSTLLTKHIQSMKIQNPTPATCQ